MVCFRGGGGICDGDAVSALETKLAGGRTGGRQVRPDVLYSRRLDGE